MKSGNVYNFLKKGQRNYWILGEISLIETNGKPLSRPRTSVEIIETIHFLNNGEIWTKGKYKL